MKLRSVTLLAALVVALSVSVLHPRQRRSDAAAAEQSAQGTVASAPEMSAPRAAHTATALPDGRVLVAGGFVEAASPKGAEVYDPGTGRFSPLRPMVATRHSHTATTMPDGKVLIAGGYGEGGATLAAVEIFDPATNAFTPTNSMLAARAGHVAVLLEDGKVLIVGGVGPDWRFLSSAEIYDPATGRFTSTGEMAVERESHAGVRLADGRVLIVGGHRGRRADIAIHASAEVYDPATCQFTRVGDMGTRRHKHDAVLLPDGTVLVTAGSDERDDRGMYDTSELFDPRTATFAPGPRLRLARHKHAGTSVSLPGGLILIAGGAARAELYDPSRRRFALVPGDARLAGYFAAVAPLRDGGALITGGYGNGTGPRASTWLYQP